MLTKQEIEALKTNRKYFIYLRLNDRQYGVECSPTLANKSMFTSATLKLLTKNCIDKKQKRIIDKIVSIKLNPYCCTHEGRRIFLYTDRNDLLVFDFCTEPNPYNTSRWVLTHIGENKETEADE